ncbi:ComF family protein [Sorangium sp. So ce260]|uniref:ComF family protein n=1 Tax=Sorangium sp. So ce260 TaxID=3133291 RepID=UPI003F6274A5
MFCAECALTTVPYVERPPRGGAGSSAAARGDLVAFARFGGAVAEGIRRFKYGDRPDLARPLGGLLLAAAREAGMSVDLVVPVPLHPRRLAERGYNQAALLAAHVADGLPASLAQRALCRVRPTAQQAQLPRDLRLQNVAGAFRVRAPERVQRRRIALVDDVATTGATLAACRGALLGAGAASVTYLVIAAAESGADEIRSSPRSAHRT